MILYHGTYVFFDTIDLRCSMDKRDFGMGFYTTTSFEQANRWALKIGKRSRVKGIVIEYEIEDFKDLKTKEFMVNGEWLDFITKNRTVGGLEHDYDIVIGPVADDTVFNVIDAYFDGDYTKDEAIKRLKAWKCQNQISFHTNNAIEKLKLRGWEYAN
ncbi:DUF3990 domain-containing protein [Clostridium botulinum]|uniref:DUF3990 domain-containing protein n=1 Tax=Clostridium botulinum TaxID=1491 RepID=UPI0007748C65|nr:DUF3990 domain-containing protein [Clostridium botulinum]NFE93580.1 DUF3990 domain-containing protein [Clostridium botulinum]NFL38141.1 DUF3990 domain-containing protein [Clostridium botulinum]NFL64371.1 DUF3990 domain-containing protein [Clostridium botulinum]NFN07918.1 DUF3990 domain-containing protein [Clostridium botulinum]NFN24177.1 DUF3990 domain-containing protein [Clostridium botulinum]